MALPKPTLPSFLAHLAETGFGNVRTLLRADGTQAHDETELIFKPLERETNEAFAARVTTEARPGDAIEWQCTALRITVARIVRREAILLRQEPDESLDQFLERVKAAKTLRETAA